VQAAAQAAVIHEAIINFKDGYDTIVGEKALPSLEGKNSASQSHGRLLKILAS